MSRPSVAIVDHVGMKAGLDHYDLSLAKALLNQNVDVIVYSNFQSNSPFVLKHFSFSFSRNIFRIFSLLLDYCTAIIRIKRKNVSWVILHIFHFSFVDLLILRIVNFFNLKICLIVHDVESLIDKGRRHLDRCLKYTDHIVVHNSYVEENLRRKTGDLSAKKISTIPHGNFISIAEKMSRGTAATRLNLEAVKKYVLFFGMIKKSKGLNVLVDAMESVAEDVHLIVAGRSRDVNDDEIGNYSSRLGDRFHLMNRYISNEERNTLFQLADVLVIPYHKVFQSGVLLMGMSYGLPVIASDIESNRLIVKDSNVLLFKSGDSADLAIKINELFNDQARRESLGKSGLEYVSKYHDWDEIGRKFKTIFSI